MTSPILRAILRSMSVWGFSTPLEIGDSIGADKFLVLALLRGLEAAGRVSRVNTPMKHSDRFNADYQMFKLRRTKPCKSC